MAPTSTVASSRISQDESELPIRQRGLFLHDHYFQDSREHFQKALDKVICDWENQNLSDCDSNKLNDWDDNIFSDRLKHYRNLRKDKNKPDSQAFTEITGEHQHKIIIDVREFMQGCLKLSIIGPHELLLEGSIEETTTDLNEKINFEKKFMLPSEAIISETTSALSSDGILTIISPNDFKDEFVPISRRGQYFSDSIFKDPHQDFNSAIRNVLERWNETSDDEIGSYRNLRRRSLEEDNQAFTEKENYLVYKIVMDVHDFLTDGEVNVKVVNDKFLEVKGCINKEEDENICKMNFSRRFTLPRNTDIENISALISSDGVLTITSPKMVEQSDFKETIIPVKLQNILKSKSSSSTSETDNGESPLNNSAEAHSVASKAQISEEKSEIESDRPDDVKENISNESIIPVTLCESKDKFEYCDTNSSHKPVSTAPESSQDNLEVKKTKDESLSKDEIPNIDLHCTVSELPIRQRGLFLRDDYFQDSREHFQQALDKILRNWDDQESTGWYSSTLSDWDENIFMDQLKCYRNLRKDQNKKDSQAFTEISNDHKHKIIIDVRDFMQGSLKLSIIGPHELLVEGSIEETTLGFDGKQTFQKRFLLPDEAVISETTSALSSDGILTIISPHDFKDEFLPISRRGQYFSDSIFKDPHQDFNSAVRNVLERWNETSEDEIASYRNLRQRSLVADNQAFTEKENFQLYKIVIDVHDFLTDGEVNVKVVNDKYLEVKGCIDKEEEDETICKKNFKRRFTLPRNTDIENISALLSSDGVLTITSPKKIGQGVFKETIIPVKLQNILRNESSGPSSETDTDHC